VTFDYNAAEIAVLEVLARAGNELGVQLQIAEVIEQDFGWVFLYESLDPKLAATAAVVFDKADGLVYIPGQATSMDAAIEQYRGGNKSRA